MPRPPTWQVGLRRSPLIFVLLILTLEGGVGAVVGSGVAFSADANLRAQATQTLAPGGHWTNITSAAGVLYAQAGGVAYMPATQSVIYFGGDNPTNGTNNITWAFHNGSWAQLHLKTSPPAVQMEAMAYDPTLQGILMFGGEGPNSNAGLNETWEYNASGWIQLHPVISPSPRASAEMIFDPVIDKMVLFGGTSNHCCGGLGLSDTWEYSNGTWAKVATTTTTPAVNDFALCFEPSYKAPVLFGGWDPNTQGPSGTTWEFHNGTWKQITSTASPPAEQGTMLAYDPILNRAVDFGGLTGAFSTSKGIHQTWNFNGSGWIQHFLPTNPGRLFNYGMVYDPAIKSVLLVGGGGLGVPGHSGTWVFN